MIERRYIKSVELRASQGDEGAMIVSGYAARFDKLSEDLGGFREKIAPGAFKRSLQSDRDVACLLNHDPSLLLGRKRNGTLQVNEDTLGLHFRCNIANTSTGRDTYRLVQRGDLDSCSFAFSLDGEDADDWSECQDPDTGERTRLRTIRRCNLMDCSIVQSPAYASTSVSTGDQVTVHSKPWSLTIRDLKDYWPQGLPETFGRELRARIIDSHSQGTSSKAARNRLTALILE